MTVHFQNNATVKQASCHQLDYSSRSLRDACTASKLHLLRVVRATLQIAEVMEKSQKDKSVVKGRQQPFQQAVRLQI